MKVAVIGAGYVGLTTAAALAWVGHDVRVVEVDDGKLARLSDGRAPFYEAHLDDVLRACRHRLTFTSDHGNALTGADVAFIAVGTPPDADGAPDLHYLWAAVDQVLSTLRPGEGPLVLVTKSTVPVGTGDELAARVHRSAQQRPVLVASNPEFLRQGRALRDSMLPDRIAVGGPQEALDVLRELYRPILDQDFALPPGLEHPAERPSVPFLEVDRRSAELSKYAANAFLAMRISFVNEIANVSDRVGADIDDVVSVIGSDPRIGRHFLHAGIGYGGSCFPKDTRALHHIASTNGYDFALLSAVIQVNQNQPLRVLDLLTGALGDLRGKRVALLGLAFKPGTDDLREAPSVPLARALLERGAEVRGHDPQALGGARRVLPESVRLCSDVRDALNGADAAVLLTEWPEYLALPPEVFRSTMQRALVVDGRNALSKEVRSQLEYRGIGRRSTLAPVELHEAVTAD